VSVVAVLTLCLSMLPSDWCSGGRGRGRGKATKSDGGKGRKAASDEESEAESDSSGTPVKAERGVKRETTPSSSSSSKATSGRRLPASIAGGRGNTGASQRANGASTNRAGNLFTAQGKSETMLSICAVSCFFFGTMLTNAVVILMLSARCQACSYGSTGSDQ